MCHSAFLVNGEGFDERAPAPRHQPSEQMSARPTPAAATLIEATRNERNTTQHLVQLGQSRSRLVDRNRHGGGASAAADGAEQNLEAPQSQGAPQAPNGLGAMTAAKPSNVAP
jgi:hypothetical protein